MRDILFLALLTLCGINVSGQPETEKDTKPKPTESKIQIRGYVQARYNRLLETNPELGCEQCDRSWGKGGGFFLRRARIIFYGQLHERVYFYFQPDFASSAGTTNHLAQIRDAYFDIGLDSKNEFRFRIGQSKLPFGFENLQSSQNRLPLDRADALNSAVSNERDLGVFFYWAPDKIRKRFSMLVRDNFKGSGDYGVFGIGLYNGQTANQAELNDNKHLVVRLSYPFEIGSQIFEPGIQAYHGLWTMPSSRLSDGVVVRDDLTYKDSRQALTLCLYPRPFGLLAEFNTGTGPAFNKVNGSIEQRALVGGFVTLSYRHLWKEHFFFPFVRGQYFDGSKKHETDARTYHVRDLEFGVEWQPNPKFELVAMYTMASRRFEDFEEPENFQVGNLLRLQAQVNF